MNNCYVVSQKTRYTLPEGVCKTNTLFFPESAMTFQEIMYTGRPDGFDIVTDCPYFIPLYNELEVFVWNNEEKIWENPDFQTFGTSFNIITHKIFNYKNTIPQAVIDGNITNVMGFDL